MKNDTKTNICKFLIALFAMIIFISFVVFTDTKSEYTSAKASIAKEKINSYSVWNFNPDVNTSKLDKVVLKRNCCICAIVASSIGIIICCIVLFSKNEKTIYYTQTITRPEKTNNNSIHLKLKEIQKTYEDGLITEAEYNQKRKEIIDKF